MNAISTTNGLDDQIPSVDRRLAILATVGSLALWIGLLGPAWVYVPAQPDANSGAIDLSFAGLASTYAASPLTLPHAYFGWLAWLLALVSTVLAIVAARTPTRGVGGLCIVVGVAQLVLTVLALKGPASWSVVVAGLGNTRLGAGLFLLGTWLLIAIGVLVVAAATQSTSRESSRQSLVDAA